MRNKGLLRVLKNEVLLLNALCYVCVYIIAIMRCHVIVHTSSNQLCNKTLHEAQLTNKSSNSSVFCPIQREVHV